MVPLPKRTHAEEASHDHPEDGVAGRDEDLTGDLRSDAESLGKARVDATYESFNGGVEGTNLVVELDDVLLFYNRT